MRGHQGIRRAGLTILWCPVAHVLCAFRCRWSSSRSSNNCIAWQRSSKGNSAHQNNGVRTRLKQLSSRQHPVPPSVSPLQPSLAQQPAAGWQSICALCASTEQLCCSGQMWPPRLLQAGRASAMMKFVWLGLQLLQTAAASAQIVSLRSLCLLQNHHPELVVPSLAVPLRSARWPAEQCTNLSLPAQLLRGPAIPQTNQHLNFPSPALTAMQHPTS